MSPSLFFIILYFIFHLVIFSLLQIFEISKFTHEFFMIFLDLLIKAPYLLKYIEIQLWPKPVLYLIHFIEHFFQKGLQLFIQIIFTYIPSSQPLIHRLGHLYVVSPIWIFLWLRVWLTLLYKILRQLLKGWPLLGFTRSWISHATRSLISIIFKGNLLISYQWRRLLRLHHFLWILLNKQKFVQFKLITLFLFLC